MQEFVLLIEDINKESEFDYGSLKYNENKVNEPLNTEE